MIVSAATQASQATSLLQVNNLNVSVITPEGDSARVVRDVTLCLLAGETLGIVGESGSGKSTLALALTGLSMPESRARISGTVLFQGQSLLNLSEEELRRVRGRRISYVFQNPDAVLSPTHSIGSQVEGIIAAHRSLNRAGRKREVVRLLDLVGIPEPHKKVDQYPHQFSGGMKQRVVIAMALANDPDLLVADEPTSALDVLAQETILNLLKELRTSIGLSMIVVSHDLRIVGQLADRMLVLYGGRVAEIGPTERVLRFPQHRYTDALLRCVPDSQREYSRDERLQTIPGNAIAVSSAEPEGCLFADRCAYAHDSCRELFPPGSSEEAEPSHLAWCWFPVSEIDKEQA